MGLRTMATAPLTSVEEGSEVDRVVWGLVELVLVVELVPVMVLLEKGVAETVAAAALIEAVEVATALALALNSETILNW